ncbi:MAG: cytochrome c3 family protein [bacterium]
MAQIFPKWFNKLPAIFVLGKILFAALVVGVIWYYFSPWYTDVGYRPEQPLAYSHKLHADDLGLDCRYCHNFVELSPHANIPPTQTCMNCHKIIFADSTSIKPLVESFALKQPIEWVRVHKLPDYAYFNHAAHLAAGVGCVSCHGQIDKMPVVTQQQPLSMSWCLDCHRDPAPHLRPVDQITNMAWVPSDKHQEWATKMIQDRGVNPPVDCSGCHR